MFWVGLLVTAVTFPVVCIGIIQSGLPKLKYQIGPFFPNQRDCHVQVATQDKRREHWNQVKEEANGEEDLDTEEERGRAGT